MSVTCMSCIHVMYVLILYGVKYESTSEEIRVNLQNTWFHSSNKVLCT